MESDDFVGRATYITRASETLMSLLSAATMDPTTFLILRGPGGIGKTKLVTRIAHLADEMGIQCSSVADLRATANRSEISLLDRLASALPRKSFEEVRLAIAGYNNAEEIDRRKAYASMIATFVTCLRAASVTTPILLILDTFEAIQGTKIERSILEIVGRIGGRCMVLIASRLDVPLKGSAINEVTVDPFSLLESEELARSMYRGRGLTYDLDATTMVELHNKARGIPILLTLAIEWILENAHPEEIISVPAEQFERRMVERIRLLQEPESFAILMMSVANRRFNSTILSILSGKSEADCAKLCSQLARFSFVKSRSDDNVLTLHDEMLRLITQYIDLPELYKNERRASLVSEYYNRALASQTLRQSRQVLTAEKMYYELYYAPHDAVANFTNEMQSAIDDYDFDYGELLLDEVTRHRLSPELQREVRLCKAEMALKQYRPAEARPILDELVTQYDQDTETEDYCRVLEGIGESIINPCTLLGADPFEAQGYWMRALDISRQHKLERRIPRSLFALGRSFGVVGQFDRAEIAFLESYSHAIQLGNHRLAARCLDELNRICRQQQSVQKALGYIERSLELKQTAHDQIGLGITYYYYGCTFRDLGNFEMAGEWFERANVALSEIGDAFNLCRLYSDMSWTAFLQDDFDMANRYVELSRELSESNAFGTEIPESWHIEYEMAIAQGRIDYAYLCLDKALEFCRAYNSVYMLLDCLHHDAQRAFALGEYDRIPEVLKEMKSVEDKGCGIRVFRGRAIIVLGDACYMLERYSRALSTWCEGLTIVARFGNSRTNVELFDDIFAHRVGRLENTLRLLGPVAVLEFKGHWLSSGLEREFPSVLSTCDHVLGTWQEAAT